MVSTFSASKPGLHGAQRQRSADQQRRADQQHHRQRDLADHQHGARLVLPEARAGASAALFQSGAQIGPRALQRGNQAEEDARSRSRDQNREGQHAPIDAPPARLPARRAAGWRYSRSAARGFRRCRAPSRPRAPASESSTLSVSSCRMMRPRPAPMAARIAISRRRPTARASSRFATFAQAISSTKLTAPTSTSSDERTLLHQRLADRLHAEALICRQRRRDISAR